MRLSNEWFTALSEDEDGHLVTVSGRDELTEFIQSGKFKERVEITWKYEGDEKGMPMEHLAMNRWRTYRKHCGKPWKKINSPSLPLFIPGQERRYGFSTPVQSAFSANV